MIQLFYPHYNLQKDPRPQVLLLGNGINRAFNLYSWDEMVKSLSDRKKTFTRKELRHISQMPYPMQADIRTDNSLNGYMQKMSDMLCNVSPCDEEKKMLSSLLPLFSSVLTTNYTYEAEKCVTDNPDSIRTKPDPLPNKELFSYLDAHADKDEVKYDRLYTYMDLGEHYPPLWHIHGEAGINKSMVLGQHYYGKIIAYARAYSYALSAKVKAAKENGRPISMDSWVDWFMLGDITIIGQGMNCSEYDLWWLISEKRKHYPQTTVTWYVANPSVESKLLAQAYGVVVFDVKIHKKHYKKYYEELIEKIKKQRGGIPMKPGYFDFVRIEEFFGNHARGAFTMTFDAMRAEFGLTPCYVNRKHLGGSYPYQFQKHLSNVHWHVASVDYNAQTITFDV